MRANAWSYLYVAPALLLLVIFVIYPLIASLGYTLYDWDGIGRPTMYVGLANFQQVMRDPLFWSAFLHTSIYTAVLVPVQLALALILALALNNRRLRGATFYRTIYFIPVVTSAAVVGVMIQLMLSTFGDDINRALLAAHVIQSDIDWLGDPRFALACIIVVGIWHGLGFNLVYFLAALQSIPGELYEAAALDGAGAPARFLYVTLPMLRAVGLVILILAVASSLRVFDLVQVMTGGGPDFATEVVNTYIYHQAFGGSGAAAAQTNIGFASAASFFYGLLLLALAGAQIMLVRSALRRRAEPRGRRG